MTFESEAQITHCSIFLTSLVRYGNIGANINNRKFIFSIGVLILLLSNNMSFVIKLMPRTSLRPQILSSRGVKRLPDFRWM